MGQEWMIALGGNKYGPYQKRELIRLIKNKQIDSKKAYVWTSGMADWVLLTNHSQFAKFVGDKFSRKINLNTAKLDEILLLPGFSLEKAKKLINGRENKDGFNDVYEIAEYIDLKPHQIEEIKNLKRVIIRNV